MERRQWNRYEEIETLEYTSEDESCGEVLVVSIDLGGGQKEELVVRDSDSPSSISESFCQKHHLSQQAKAALISQITYHFPKPLVTSNCLSTNSPFITQKSSASLSKSPILNSKENLDSNNFGQKLYQKGLKFIESVNKKKLNFVQEQNEKEKQEITFKPKINKGESFIGKSIENDSGADRFLKLYENAKITQDRIRNEGEKLKRKECPFEPDIGESKRVSERIVRDNGRREQIARSRRAIEDYLNQRNSLKDVKTGQELFKPVIGRPPKNRQVNPSNIGDYLYSKRNKSQDPSTRSTTIKHASPQSENILNRLKTLRYTQLFINLNPTNQNLLTPTSIKDSTLSPRTYKILSPLLEELESLNEELNFSEFCESMDILLKSLTPEQRATILKTSKEKPLDEKHDFKPKTNENCSRPQSVESLYDRNVKKLKWAQEKCEIEKKIKEDNELAECTFKPKILKYEGSEESVVEEFGWKLSRSFYK